MTKRGRRYSAEYRRQLIELGRAGRTAENLFRKFEPSARAICNRVVQADRDEGRRSDGWSGEERRELRALRREVLAFIEGCCTPRRSKLGAGLPVAGRFRAAASGASGRAGTWRFVRCLSDPAGRARRPRQLPLIPPRAPLLGVRTTPPLKTVHEDGASSSRRTVDGCATSLRCVETSLNAGGGHEGVPPSARAEKRDYGFAYCSAEGARLSFWPSGGNPLPFNIGGSVLRAGF